MIHPTLCKKYLFYFLLSIIIISCNNERYSLDSVQLTKKDSLVIYTIDKHFVSADFIKTLTIIDSVKKTYDFANHKLFRLKVLEYDAKANLKLNRPQIALDEINQIIFESEFERDDYNDEFVSATLLKGYVYYGLGDYRSAYKYYFAARESDYGQGKNCEFAVYDYRISLSLYRQNKFEDAIINFKESFIHYRDCSNKDFWTEFKRQEILSNIGLSFYKLQKYDSAIFYYDSALAFIKLTYKLKDVYPESLEVAEGVIIGNKGKAYLAIKDYDKAIPLLHKNVVINSKKKFDNLDAVTSRIALGTYYLEKKDYVKFNEITSVPDSYYTYPHFKKQLVFLHQLKSEYYENIGNFKLALHHRKKLIEDKEFLFREQQKINDSDVQLTLESLERENELNKLSKENNKRENFTNFIIYISVGLIIITLMIGIFLRSSNKKNKQLKESNSKVRAQRELLKKANAEITYNNEILKERDLEKNKILSIVAHDLRNPTNAINSIANTLKTEDNLTADQIEYLNLIEISAKSTNDLIHEILQFAKPGQFDNNAEVVVFNCKELLLQTISLTMFKANQKLINIELDPINPSLKIYINVEKMRRAITNILVNAIKFSHKNTIINVFCTNTEDDLSIHIKDHGIGIPDRIKDYIFISDPIIRRAGTDGEASYGLGLAIVKQIVEENNGKISFASSNQGTQFTITLPLYKQNSDSDEKS
jgi:signal transduction histidine kinase